MNTDTKKGSGVYVTLSPLKSRSLLKAGVTSDARTPSTTIQQLPAESAAFV